MRARSIVAIVLGLVATLTAFLVALDLRNRSEDRALAIEARVVGLAARAIGNDTDRAIWAAHGVITASNGDPETFTRMLSTAAPDTLAGARLYLLEANSATPIAEFGDFESVALPNPAEMFAPGKNPAAGGLSSVRLDGPNVRIVVTTGVRTATDSYIVALDYRLPFSDLVGLVASSPGVGLELFSDDELVPARLLLSTRDPKRPILRSVSESLAYEGYGGPLVVSASKPLTTGVTRTLPMIVAVTGSLLALTFGLLGWLMARRRQLLDELTKEKVRLDLVIAEHPRSLAEIEANATRYRRILDSSPDVMMTVALSSGRLSLLNRRDLLGHPGDALDLEGFTALFDDESRPEFEKSVQVVSGDADTTLEAEARLLNSDGEPEWIRYRLAAVADSLDRTPTHLVVVLTSIREQKRTADKQAQLEQQLRQAQRLEALGQLAGGVAHDLNNVLASVLSLAELVGMDDLTQQSRADVNEIKKSSRRGADLVRQLLVFARRDPAQPAPVDLNEIVTGVQSLLARTLSQAIELEVSLAANLPPVLADPASLEQVLLNLAVNARDAMEGHGQLTLETSLVWLDDRYAETRPGVAAGPFVRLMVTDDGCGMTQEVQARIFDPFFTTKAIGDGTGLGLATVYGIVIQLGGHIDVYSEPGRGTAFKLYLPLEPVAGGPAAAVPPQPLRSGFGQTILLVEDEETLRRSTERLLRHHGYEVTVAADGPSAVALGQQRHFDLALVDMVMPGGLSGRDVVSRLRERDPHLPAVFVSGYSEAVMARHGALDTASVLLEKPFAAEDLLRLVAEALQGARLAG